MHGSIATDAPLHSSDWKWQQKNLINSTAELLARFPGLAGSPQYQNIEHNLESRKLGLTPYLANLIKTDAQQRPVSNDPIWLQVAPVWARPEAQRFEYDGESENWELPHEMVTDICQHKYDNRVIIRTANVCHAYCQFCYEALRTLETDTQKKAFKKSEWQQTVDYIATHPAVEEVILSGGEPLMLSDERLDSLLSSLRAARPDIIIRLHTRALTFNPYRITDALVDVLKKGRVNAVGLHVSHRQEITDDFLDAVAQAIIAIGDILLETAMAETGLKIDLVDVFRRAEHTPDVLAQAMNVGAGAVWLQQGIRNDMVEAKAKAAGLPFLMDRCLKTEHQRLYLV